MKKIFLHIIIISLIVFAVVSIVLKYKYESDFLRDQYLNLDAAMSISDDLSLEKRNEIGKIAKEYKYHVYTYNFLAFLAFAISGFLIFKRKKILQEKNGNNVC